MPEPWYEDPRAVVPLIGVAINLIWNFFNFRQTTAIKRSERNSDFRLEEFGRIRSALEDKMDEVEELTGALNAALLHGEISKQQAELERVQKELAQPLYGKMKRSFRR